MKKEKIISSSDFYRHPGWFNAVNAVWRRSFSKGSSPLLNKDEMLFAARRATGLNDFGKDFWDEPLDRLIQSLNHEADLHPIGAFITRKRIVNLLSVRLRAENWFRLHPEILEQELYPPMVIVGLQRTGTTKLHRLLSADPDNRVLKSWEAINPVPLEKAVNGKNWKKNGSVNGKDLRMKAAKTSEVALRKMAPGFFAIHPVEYTAPEEDILLLDVTFLSTTPEAITMVPSYASWLETVDQSYAYDYGSRLLKFLQWQQPGKRWILKSPHHLEFMHLVEKYYGNPRFIWTHREISECIPSFISMVCHSRALFSDNVEASEVAQHWVRKTGYMLEKGLSFRQSGNNENKFSDILYEDLVADSMSQLTRIYEQEGGIPASLADAFRKAEIENPKGKYGVHSYGLEEFGLAYSALEERNSAYLNLFNGLLDKGPERAPDSRVKMKIAT
jgi:hypothetical protein